MQNTGAIFVLRKELRNTFNQTWHLPTYNPAIDGKIFIEIEAKETGNRTRHSVLKKFMIKMAGLFDATLSQIYEMLYQNEYEYSFDSTKFNNYFQTVIIVPE